MSATFKVNAEQFGRDIKQYLAHFGKDARETVNQTAFDIAAKAASVILPRNTEVQKAKIFRELNTKRTGEIFVPGKTTGYRGGVMTLESRGAKTRVLKKPMTLAARLVLTRLRARGQPGIGGRKLYDAARRFIFKRQDTAGVIRAQLLPVWSVLVKLVKYKQFPRIGAIPWRIQRLKGAAQAAVDKGSGPVAIFSFNFASKKAHLNEFGLEQMTKGINAGFRSESAKFQRRIERDLKKRWDKGARA